MGLNCNVSKNIAYVVKLVDDLHTSPSLNAFNKYNKYKMSLLIIIVVLKTER